MVNLIEIIINSGALISYNLLIFPKKNSCYLNNKMYNLDSKKISDILSLISLWKNEYGTKEGIDQEEFTITITTTDKKIEKIHGKGIYPNNYKRLLDLIGDIHE